MPIICYKQKLFLNNSLQWRHLYMEARGDSINLLLFENSVNIITLHLWVIYNHVKLKRQPYWCACTTSEFTICAVVRVVTSQVKIA